MSNRLFLKANNTVSNLWEPVEFEAIKAEDKIKMVELSPSETEVMIQIWDVTHDYNPKTGVFEGHQLGADLYLPASKEMKEMCKNANKPDIIN